MLKTEANGSGTSSSPAQPSAPIPQSLSPEEIDKKTVTKANLYRLLSGAGKDPWTQRLTPQVSRPLQ
jgi:hypothetical protein